MPSSIRLTASGFDAVIWRINEKEREFSGNASISLAAENFLLGQHRIFLKVIKDSVPYSKTISLVVVL
jgi:hypothetical protein